MFAKLKWSSCFVRHKMLYEQYAKKNYMHIFMIMKHDQLVMITTDSIYTNKLVSQR